MASVAQQTWLTAQKARRAIFKQIEHVKKDTGDKKEESRLDSVEELLSDFRLACAQTIFGDFKFAAEHDVEGALWQVHSYVNNEYRGLLGRLKVPQQLVTKRKVERLYARYLRTAQYFYKGYIQRLWARYDLPQLERIAQCIRIEPLQNAGVERVDAASVKPEITKSCHDTLIHLGDLSRYRSKARQKVHVAEAALTYYALAQDLKPDSGFAHHQMGVVHLDDKKHLEIVYHFYRAWAVEKPHPNAANNLEVEFKSLLLPSTPSRRSGPPDAHEAFSSWFVRLHARFFKGEAFSQHAEMEEEVLHRFEMILKSPDVISLLLKMVLINISAYHIAKMKVDQGWTMDASQSCQFILRLNVRYILILARQLKAELQSTGPDQLAPPPGPKGKQAEVAGRGTAATTTTCPYADNILPLLRLYAAWICVCRADLVKYEEHLEPYIHDMYRTLAQCVTTLVREFGQQSLAPAPYLLSEDLEAVGLKPLDCPSMPAECRLQRLADNDVRKPRAEELGSPRQTPREETLSRVYDVLGCVFHLAADPAFPLVADMGDGESLQAVTIHYREESVRQQQPDKATDGNARLSFQPDASVSDLTTRMSSFEPGFDQPEAAAAAAPPTAGDSPLMPTAGGDQGCAAFGQPGGPDRIPREQRRSGRAAPDTESEFSIDRDMYKMVNDFLAPPESRPPRAAAGLDESSYGMHSSTANEVFGALPAKSPAPRAAAAAGKAFPTLPWNFFISPTPHGADQARSPGPAGGWDSFRQPGLEDPFVSPRTPQPTGDLESLFGKAQPAQHGASSARAGADAPLAQQQQQQPSASFPAARTATSSGHLPSRSAEGRQGSAPQQGWSAVAGPEGSGFGPTASSAGRAGAGLEGAAFSSTAFSQQTSSLPPVNSPWGLPAAQAGARLAAAPRRPGQPPLPAGYGSQPGGGGYQTAVYNGNVYHATTAFGRGPVPSRDDPTHFRNAVKRTYVGSAVQAADEYDRAVLASALGGKDEKKPRAKG